MNPLVLIIDDSELILQMLDMVCQAAGFRTVTCERIDKVVDVTSAELPDVIISDLNLPDLDGDDPVVVLHSIPGLDATPVVIVSGMAPDELDARAHEIGAAGAISKEAGMPAMQAQLPDLLAALCA